MSLDILAWRVVSIILNMMVRVSLQWEAFRCNNTLSALKAHKDTTFFRYVLAVR